MCKEAGFKPKSSHSLSVTCASALFNTGVKEKLIRDRTGHRSNVMFKYEKVSKMKSTEVSDILAPKCSSTCNFFSTFLFCIQAYIISKVRLKIYTWLFN